MMNPDENPSGPESIEDENPDNLVLKKNDDDLTLEEKTKDGALALVSEEKDENQIIDLQPNDTPQLNTDPESKQLSINEEKQKLTKITELLKETATSLTDITTNLSSDEPNIEKAVIDLKTTAEKLQSDKPLEGGKSRRKAYKNKKKNKTKKGGRKSKKNQKNKR